MKTLIVVTALIVTSVAIAVSPPTDRQEPKTPHGVDTTTALGHLWWISPAIAICSAPNPTAVYTNYGWRYIGTNFVCATTTIVQRSQYTPLSWDTTTWPIANQYGKPFGVLIITNPPRAVVELTNGVYYSIPFSSIWYNVTGNTNGWVLLQ